MSFTSHASPTRRLVWLLKPERILLACVVLGASLAILRCIPLIVSPYQIDYGEGLMLDGALRLRHSQPLYSNPFAFPIVIHVYGPAAYGVAALVLPGGRASFPAGRFLILACSVAISLLLGSILRRLTGSWWISLSFGLLLLTLPAFRFWLYLFRADVIGVFFSITGVTLYLLAGKRWYWSIPFFALAMFCKYTLVAAPLAVFFHLILERKVKQSFGFAIGLGSACALAFVFLQFKTGGWFAFHMFSTHPDRYSLTQFFALEALTWASAPVVTALAVWWIIQDFRSKRPGLPSLYFAASSITALTAGKLGSTTNHFVEWMAACCLCAGLGYSWLLSRYPARSVPLTLLLGASLLIAVVAQNRPGLQPTREMTEGGQAYLYLKQAPSSRVLSESLGPVLLAGKPLLISDPFVFGQSVQHGVWPGRHVEELIDGQYFGLIVMSRKPAEIEARGSDIWPESLATAIARNYRTVKQFTCHDSGVILEPISRTPAQ